MTSNGVHIADDALDLESVPQRQAAVLRPQAHRPESCNSKGPGTAGSVVPTAPRVRYGCSSAPARGQVPPYASRRTRRRAGPRPSHRAPGSICPRKGPTVNTHVEPQEAVIDYDSPRHPPIENDDGLDELKVRGSARSPTADLDEVETADGIELSGADMSGEELTVPVVPIRADELRCSRCFLVQHRSRFTTRVGGQEVCLDCS
jgi:hypothetical protein